MKAKIKEIIVVVLLGVISMFTGVFQNIFWGYSTDTAFLAGLIHWVILNQVYFYIIKDVKGRKG